MTRAGDLFARVGSSLARFGTGISDPPKKEADPRAWQDLVIANFSGGYDSSMVEEMVKPDSSPLLLDLELDKKQRLVVMPGITTIETLTYTPTEMFAHGALDDFVDIVLIYDKYMGIRSGGVTTWYDVGFPSGGGWVVCLHGEQLLLSNNSRHSDVFARDVAGTTVIALGWGEAGSLLSFAGRAFAFNCSIGGVFNPLGAKWTGVSGLATDVTGEGSGFELLLDEATAGDHIVAARELGFDLMVVVLRKSIWIGTPSGDISRPVDFRPRIAGVGAVSEPTVRTVQGGVMFLADDGVKFFDGNGVKHTSAPIDADLLPLDFTQLRGYSASYNAVLGRYVLHTPTATWSYEIVNDRWLRSSAIISRSLGIFNPLTQSYTGLTAGWGLDWGGFWGNAPVGGVTSLFDSMLYLKGNLLGRPDSAATAYFGTAQTPTWQSPRADGENIEAFVCYDHFSFEYEGAAVASLYVPDGNGDLLRLFKAHTLAAAAVRRHSKAYAPGISGLGLGCKITFSSTAGLKIRRIAARYRTTTQRVTTP